MWANAIAAYLHYLSLGLIFTSLSTELFTLKQDLTNREGWRILIADTIYGIAGITVLVTGILRYLYFEKGADYYSHQPVFWMKISVFIVVGLLSLYPTVSFLMWIKSLRAEKPPEVSLEKVKTLKTIIHVELVGFSVIPLLATMMARGITLFHKKRGRLTSSFFMKERPLTSLTSQAKCDSKSKYRADLYLVTLLRIKP